MILLGGSQMGFKLTLFFMQYFFNLVRMCLLQVYLRRVAMWGRIWGGSIVVLFRFENRFGQVFGVFLDVVFRVLVDEQGSFVRSVDVGREGFRGRTVIEYIQDRMQRQCILIEDRTVFIIILQRFLGVCVQFFWVYKVFQFFEEWRFFFRVL